MKRIYDNVLKEHFTENRQMAFLTGPRQVGKTTTSGFQENNNNYFTWDDQKDREFIIKGADNIHHNLKKEIIGSKPIKIIFDEIHKYSKWKSFLKGFFDKYQNDYEIIVTGSARLNIYKRGGDSLMGRYFSYKMHPLTIAEILNNNLSENLIRHPQKIDKQTLEQLLEFGGFPEPFLKANKRFYNKWQKLRTEQFFYEDLRDLTKVQEIAQIQMLAEILKNQTGQLINYSKLALDINVSVDTIRRWISILESMYNIFVIRPWYNNVPKSLRKQPKIYLWDWSNVSDKGARYENFIASHLLKAVNYWTDTGLGDFNLFFLRDKLKREVDFLVTQNNHPWFLVEVKSSSNRNINPNLKYFQSKINAEFAFQVVNDLDFINQDCFTEKNPVIVPDVTFLSQLI